MSDNKPLAASEVVTSMGLLAFKTLDESRRTVIGYATYGQRVNYQPSNSKSSETPDGSSPTPPEAAMEKKESPSQLSKIDEAFLAEVLKNEEMVYNAYKNVMSEKEAKQKVSEGMIGVCCTSDKIDIEISAMGRVYSVDEGGRTE